MRQLNLKSQYGDLWGEALEMEEARDEIRLWEERLVKAELKWIGKDAAVKYANKRIEEAKDIYREALQNYKEAQKA